MNKPVKPGLSAEERSRLTLLVGRQASGSRPQAGAARLESGEREPMAAMTDFTTLSGFKELSIQLQMSAMVGLENPYFRVHEARAGATTQIAGKTYDNFSSYDYLGLNGLPEVTKAAQDACARYGTSASASRLVAGERPLHSELETALARHYGAEAGLVMVSGHATNVAALSTMLGPRDLILHDTLAHNSIIVGATLAKAERRSFPHNDFATLDEMLTQLRRHYERVLIVIEGLYSMDGDIPDLASFVAIKRRHAAWLMVDEAHALGVVGSTGKGTFEASGIDPADVDIWMGTLSKTLAGCGGYLVGQQAMIDYLKHFAPGFVYSVGLAPPLAAASLAALKALHAGPDRVAALRTNGQLFLSEARRHGLDTGTSEGLAVVPIILGDSILAIALSQRMANAGINVQPIIHPAVPERSARLRFFITSEHTPEQIRYAARTAADELAHLGSSREILSNPALLLG